MKFAVVLGTRPEAIKLAPLVHALRAQFPTTVISTGQHRHMLDQVLNLFEIEPDRDLNLMKPNQSLTELAGAVLSALGPVFRNERPDWVVAQGDTSTAFAAALAAFYAKIPVAHVEAGLRTYNMNSPFPEEANRQLVSRLTGLHFCPTASNRANLLREGVNDARIRVTGNTVIDALFWVLKNREPEPLGLPFDVSKERTILVTGHRRENFGEGFRNICRALREIAEKRPAVRIVYPMHLNPNVRRPVLDILSGLDNLHLIEPLNYASFAHLMNRSYLVLTDSGGVQEEAPSLGKPVLVMRDNTERPEAVEAGTVGLVGAESEMIVERTLRLLDDEGVYRSMAYAHNPYGDGKACERIISAFENESEPQPR